MSTRAKPAVFLLLAIAVCLALVLLKSTAQSLTVQPPTSPPQNPPPGNNANDGEPVDTFTGLFVHTETDLVLNDVIPIALTRTYRQADTFNRSFGVGTSDNYDIYLSGDISPYTFIDLNLADGGIIHFARDASSINSTCTSNQYTCATFTHTATPTPFYGATAAWNGNG